MATTVDSRRETVSLIGSDKVESTPVYGADDRKIGTVQRVMIDKISGKVAYAVISFGGFLGMGEDYYPMPWASLKYDTSVGGYRVGVTEDQLKGAPKYNRNTEWDWSDRRRDKAIYDYYRAPLWYACDQKAGRMPSSLLFSAPSCRNCDTTPLSRTIGVAIRHYRAEERLIRTDA